MANPALKRIVKRRKRDLAYFTSLSLKIIGSILPRWFGVFFFGNLGRLFFLFPTPEKKLTIKHLRQIYKSKWTEKKILKTARMVYVNLGKNIFDMIFLSRLSDDKFNRIVKPDCMDEFDRAYSKSKGVIVITAHVGCFEMLLPFFARKGYRSFALGQKVYDNRIDEMISEARTGPNMEYLHRSDNPREIIRRLKEGKAFGVLLDQDTSVEGVFARFLGKLAFTPSGVVKLATKYSTPVFVALTRRDDDGIHRVCVNRLCFRTTGNLDEDIVRNAQMVNDIISDTIDKYPSQWVWMHRRWHHQPDTPGYENVLSIDNYPE